MNKLMALHGGNKVLVVFTLAAQVLTLLGMLFAASMVGASRFGSFSATLALSTTLSVVLNLRLENALLIATDEEWPTLYRVAFLLTLVGGCLVFALGVVAESVNMVAGYNSAAVAAIASSLAAYQLQSAVQLRKGGLKRLGWSRLVRSIAFIVLLPLLVTVHAELLVESSLLLSTFIGMMVCGRERLLSRGGERAPLKLVFLKYYKSSLFLVPGALMNQVSQQLLFLVMPFLYGLHSAGLCAMASRVSTSPSAALGLSLSDNFRSDYARSLRESPKGSCVVWGMWIRRFVLLGGFAGVLILLGALVIMVLHLEDWLASLPFVWGLLVLSVAQIPGSAMSVTLVLTKSEKTLFLWQVCLLVLLVGWIFVARGLSVSSVHFVWGFVLCYGAMYVCMLALCWRAAKSQC